jgi:hypothetical protein
MCVKPRPISLQLRSPGGTGGVSSRELGVDSGESVDEAVCGDQKTQLCGAEHSVRSLVGSGVEGVEWLPNRGHESVGRTLIARARSGG